MDKNIYEVQNQEIILKALVAQDKLYSKAKRINYLSLFLCVILPITYSVIKEFLSGEVFITIGSLFTIVLILVAPALSSFAFAAKKKAATVQQTVDFFLFEDESFRKRDDNWGNLYTMDELCTVIAKTKTTQKDMDKKRNWYSDYSSQSHVMQAYYSQCQCVRWDDDLRKVLL